MESLGEEQVRVQTYMVKNFPHRRSRLTDLSQLEADHNVTRGIHQNKMKFLVMFTRAVKRYINYREGALKEGEYKTR